MSQVFPDFDNIQSADWGWGVFYPTDSNAADFRCRYLWWYDSWDCPGGWIQSSGQWSDDTTRGAAGYYDWGNPNIEDHMGGGAGCHRDKGDLYQGNFLDQ